MTANVRLDTHVLDRIKGDLPKKRGKLIRETAFRVEDKAKRMTPLLTGALRSSGYTSTDQGSTHAAGAAEAEGRRPGVGITEEAAPEAAGNAIVGFSVEYALFIELGTSRMAARPFLVPAVEAERPEFERMAKELVE
jgi:HK97 gp10 family phage protein